MNPYLEQHGIDVVETDLGERIIQLLDQKPSHIVMPAIHLKREEVGKMFRGEGYLQGNRQLRPDLPDPLCPSSSPQPVYGGWSRYDRL